MPAPLASDYALPAYAQTSPQDQVSFAIPTHAALSWTFTADGDYIYLVTSAFAQIVSDATAGNRVITFSYFDATGHTLAIAQSPTAQGPNTTFDYTGNVNGSVGSATSGTVTFVSVPLLAIPLSAGMSFQFAGYVASDGGGVPFMTVLRYSTAPADTPTPVRTPTPILL